MRTLFIILFLLSLVVSSTVVFGKPTPRRQSFDCRHIGVSKVKPYNFKHWKQPKKVVVYHCPKFRA
jgi:hypothetical protein